MMARRASGGPSSSHIGDQVEPMSVQDRVRQRVVVLRQWLDQGIPTGRLGTVPRSLRGARVWEDAEFLIRKIGSPNDFTVTHRTWGREVQEIARLIAALHAKYRRPNQKAPTSVAAKKADTEARDSVMRNVVSQWHTERAKVVELTARAASEIARCRLLQQECDQRDREIADLRRQLMKKRGLSVVE
jgi:hypothetical protein